MGTLTLTELEVEIRSNFGNRTDLDSRLVVALNLAQMRIARKHRWEELESVDTNVTAFTSVPASDKLLTLPTGLRDIYSIKLLDGMNSRKLIRVPARLWDKKIPMPDALTTGRPKFYALRREIIEFYPVPDAVYNLEIFSVKWPTAFASASPSALSDLDQKDDMIIYLSTSYLYMSLRNKDEASRWWTIYKDMMNDAVGEEVEKPDIDFKATGRVTSESITSTPWADPFVTSLDDM